METLKPLVESLTELIKNGTNFVSGQVPEVAQQILAYHAWQSGLGIVLGLAILLIWGTVFYFCEHPEAKGMVSLIMVPIGSLVLIANTLTFIKIQVAPKVFLLEYLKAVLK